MKITPLDIKKQEFETKFRGFDKTEVISFLETVSAEVEDLLRENLELKEKLQRAGEKLATYSKIEAALQNTLMTTQESAEQMKKAAREKAELIIREANSRAEKIIDEVYEKISRMRQDYSSLKSQKAAFLVSFRSLLDSQLKLLEMMEKQNEKESRTIVIRKKAELSEADVDKVAEEFERNEQPVVDRKIDVPDAAKKEQ